MPASALTFLRIVRAREGHDPRRPGLLAERIRVLDTLAADGLPRTVRREPDRGDQVGVKRERLVAANALADAAHVRHGTPTDDSRRGDPVTWSPGVAM